MNKIYKTTEKKSLGEWIDEHYEIVMGIFAGGCLIGYLYTLFRSLVVAGQAIF